MNIVPRILGRASTPHAKREILERLAAVWENNPQLRLGQLIGNTYHSTDPGGTAQYYAEDYAFIEKLEEHYKEQK